MGYKEEVKEGKITPRDAMRSLIATNIAGPFWKLLVVKTRTYQWLRRNANGYKKGPELTKGK